MKKFIVLLLVLVIVFSCAGCGVESRIKWNKDHIETFGFVVINQFGGMYGSESGCYLVYDPATNVEYICHVGSYGNFSLCPYYDETGNVVIYGGK